MQKGNSVIHADLGIGIVRDVQYGRALVEWQGGSRSWVPTNALRLSDARKPREPMRKSRIERGPS